MKIQLINLPSGPILVSDDPIKNGWHGYVYKANVESKIFKIIAGIGSLPGISFSLPAAINYRLIVGEVYDVEVEMESYTKPLSQEEYLAANNQNRDVQIVGFTTRIPKITNNSIIVTKIL